MAMCPLIKAECIREKCEWWRANGQGKNPGCAIALLPDKIDEISKRLDDTNYRLDIAFSEINIDGERLIANYNDEMKDIPKKE